MQDQSLSFKKRNTLFFLKALEIVPNSLGHNFDDVSMVRYT